MLAPPAGFLARLLPALVLVPATALPAPAQVGEDPFDTEELPFEAARSASATPRVTFELVTEIPLPGPLPGDAPRAVDGRVVIRAADGQVVTALSADSDAGPPSSGAGVWVRSADGRMRFRTGAGRVVAERRCNRCRRGWKRAWRVRVAGTDLAPPLPMGDRVCFGALDNYVYCLNPRNGHRLWVTDVDGRISRPLVGWTGVLPAHDPAGASGEIEVVLAVVDGGSAILALGAADGRRLASVRLEEGDGVFVAVPLPMSEGRFVAARQWYRRDLASLMVYRLTSPAPPDEAAPQPREEPATR